MTAVPAMVGRLTTQTREGCSPASGLPWHPGSDLEWHAAGYEDAMRSVIDLALALAGRPESTAQDTLRGVIELALGVIELRWPGPAGGSASQQGAP